MLHLESTWVCNWAHGAELGVMAHPRRCGTQEPVYLLVTKQL